MTITQKNSLLFLTMFLGFDSKSDVGLWRSDLGINLVPPAGIRVDGREVIFINKSLV